MSIWRDAWLEALRAQEQEKRNARTREPYGTGIADVDFEPEGDDSFIASSPFLGTKTRFTVKVEPID
jgi:hypothetical protein